METITDILRYVSISFILLPIGISLILFNRYDKTLQIFSIFLYLSGLFEASRFITSSLKINIFPLFHLFTIVELFFLGLIFFYAFQSSGLRGLLLFLLGLCLVYTLVNSIFFEEIWLFNANARLVEGIFMVLMSLLLFRHLLRSPEVVHVENFPLFWINSGILFYFSGTLFLLLWKPHLMQLPAGDCDIHRAMQAINTIIANLIFGIALLCKPPVST
jgi:hypothetical protein